MLDRFINNAEIQAEKAESLRIFSGVKLLHIRKQIELILSKIGNNGIFQQYTKHDISHIDEMIKMLDWIIPEQTQKVLTSSEWMMLVLSIYFHDMGMLVTNKEFENRNNSGFSKYKQTVYLDNKGSEYSNKVDSLMDEKDKFLYQEYVRKNHASRVRKWIQGEIDIDSGECHEIIKEINKLLDNIDNLFKEDLGIICESHHLNNLDDYSIYNTKKRYASSDNEVVNLQYIAVILRTADLLHITMDRTPTVEYRLICPTDPVSVIEWQKQMAIRAVAPKEKQDEDGNVSDKLPKDTIEIIAYFEKSNQAEAFFALMDYLRYAREELKINYDLIQNSAKKQGTKNYLFPWINIDDEGIKTKEFERNLLKFELNQSNILQMLVGHTLYNDSSVVLRELIQNGLDAIKLQNKIEKQNGASVTSGRLNIYWNSESRILEFNDNGTGMTIYEIENYLLKIGSSKYSSKEFEKVHPDFVSISRFGIGILTCFLVANDVEILTNSTECEEANLITLRNVDGKYLLKKIKKSELENKISSHGTTVKLHVREEISLDNIKNELKKWILFPYCDVFFQKNDEQEVRIGYNSPREAIENYLSQGVISINENIVVKEETVEGITLAYAVRYSEYLQEYSLVENDLSNYSYEELNMPVPIGVCFEGVRVSDNTPGFKMRNFIAIMNSNNSKIAQTNVARSSIEDNSSKEELLKIIYGIYKKFVLDQIDSLLKRNYSLSWISGEVKYLIDPLFHLRRQRELHDTEWIENVEVLKSVFSELEGILFEENKERKLVSAKYIQSKDIINFVESNLISAAESLLRETKGNITLNKLANTLSGELGLQAENLMCNYESSNILHEEAIKEKYAFKIDIQRDERKIDICYKNIENPWVDIILIDKEYPLRSRNEIVHIPKSMNGQMIKGLNGEFGVRTKNGVYLSYEHKLTQYINKKMQLFHFLLSETELTMFRIFISYMLNSRILSISKSTININDVEQYFYSMAERDNLRSFTSDIIEGLWKKIDRDEFLSTVFEERCTIFDTADWSRYNRFMYDINY